MIPIAPVGFTDQAPAEMKCDQLRFVTFVDLLAYVPDDAAALSSSAPCSE